MSKHTNPPGKPATDWRLKLGASPDTRAFESIAAALVGIAGGWGWAYAVKNNRLLLPEVTEEYARQLKDRILAEPITAVITVQLRSLGLSFGKPLG